MTGKFKWLARKDYENFVHDNGHEPMYAECSIAFQGAEPERATFALFPYDVDVKNDDGIFFYCNGLEELLNLSEDFEVIKVLWFFNE